MVDPRSTKEPNFENGHGNDKFGINKSMLDLTSLCHIIIIRGHWLNSTFGYTMDSFKILVTPCLNWKFCQQKSICMEMISSWPKHEEQDGTKHKDLRIINKTQTIRMHGYNKLEHNRGIQE
jgi:hypothetical protein